uniref:Uncharacterized protein n=1 Tax=Zea mays TaxID=4577 RepID=B6T2F2_MAIZE|nr:hypothetical protein [Zea mays]
MAAPIVALSAPSLTGSTGTLPRQRDTPPLGAPVLGRRRKKPNVRYTGPEWV